MKRKKHWFFTWLSTSSLFPLASDSSSSPKSSWNNNLKKRHFPTLFGTRFDLVFSPPGRPAPAWWPRTRPPGTRSRRRGTWNGKKVLILLLLLVLFETRARTTTTTTGTPFQDSLCRPVQPLRDLHQPLLLGLALPRAAPSWPRRSSDSYIWIISRKCFLKCFLGSINILTLWREKNAIKIPHFCSRSEPFQFLIMIVYKQRKRPV